MSSRWASRRQIASYVLMASRCRPARSRAVLDPDGPERLFVLRHGESKLPTLDQHLADHAAGVTVAGMAVVDLLQVRDGAVIFPLLHG
jgi:hypothetical protein